MYKMFHTQGPIAGLQKFLSRMLMAHAYNSEGRDQEDWGSKPDPANSSWNFISKKPITKKGPMEWLNGRAYLKNTQYKTGLVE
jgi:hypothetical protein